MMKRTLMLSVLTVSVALFGGFAIAADQDEIYGSQLMTQQERTEYHSKMHAANTAQKREQIRTQHHEQMQERAKQRGATLPDEPPGRGNGMGRSGWGMGPRGDGMGSGGDRGQ